MVTVITGIRLGHTGTGTERITAVWTNGITQQVADVILRIRAGAIYRSGSIVGPVVKVGSRNGRQYIHTEPNYTEQDNLLSLPQF